MKNKITFKNTILKTGDNLFKKGLKFLRERGVFFFAKKLSNTAYTLTKRFVREYIPLKVMYFFSEDGEIVRKIQGSKMILDLNDVGISRELAAYGVHEKNSTAEVKRIITPGMKILEVGANIGYYALIETKLAGPSGFLYAMEPSPFNYELLKANLKINKMENYDLSRVAAGAEDGTAKFMLSGRSNLSSFVERDDLTGEVIDVNVVKLDVFLEDKKVDFIRMDVEGYEGEILKGAEETLAGQNKPRYFFIEIHSELLHKKKSSARDIVEFLGQYGYEVRKSFWRGSSKVAVSTKEEMLAHPLLEVGYWETFFELKESVKRAKAEAPKYTGFWEKFFEFTRKPAGEKKPGFFEKVSVLFEGGVEEKPKTPNKFWKTIMGMAKEKSKINKSEEPKVIRPRTDIFEFEKKLIAKIGLNLAQAKAGFLKEVDAANMYIEKKEKLAAASIKKSARQIRKNFLNLIKKKHKPKIKEIMPIMPETKAPPVLSEVEPQEYVGFWEKLFEFTKKPAVKKKETGFFEKVSELAKNPMTGKQEGFFEKVADVIKAPVEEKKEKRPSKFWKTIMGMAEEKSAELKKEEPKVIRPPRDFFAFEKKIATKLAASILEARIKMAKGIDATNRFVEAKEKLAAASIKKSARQIRKNFLDFIKKKPKAKYEEIKPAAQIIIEPKIEPPKPAPEVILPKIEPRIEVKPKIVPPPVVSAVEPKKAQKPKAITVKVSVIMSVYNGFRYLDKAIESILGQSFKDFEFIIVNDASTDSTADILDKYKSADNRIKVITNDFNFGLTKSLNIGIDEAGGEYIARLDADDISYPERLQAQVEFLDKHPEVGLVGSYAFIINGSGLVTDEMIYPTDGEDLKKDLIKYNPFIHSSIMLRKKVLHEAGLYDPEWKYAQDYELYFRLSRYCEFANLPKFLVASRRTADSITGAKNKEQTLWAIKARMKALKEGVYPASSYVSILRPLMGYVMPSAMKASFKKIKLPKIFRK